VTADRASGSELAVAIVGLAGRFPGARSVDELWTNLCDGVESITTFGDRELAASVPAALRDDPAYVPRSGVLDGIELFDAGFFGFSPREAELIDPQRRLFMEGCWEALEHAGYDPRRYPGAIGLYAGTGLNGYLLFNLLSRGDLLEDPFELQIASDKDFLATHVAYKLDLRGPCLDIQTACSTSLVAVHLACQALLAGECDMALAGGVAVRVPHRTGYRYRAGAILSPDGHCRAFDARAGGTVGGNGLGLVVLKRLDDAIADRDTIHAVVRGSAINNDGATKVGFSAPSVDGQARVVRAALGAAALDATSVGYIEAHGTGTPLGDPIELAALKQVFRGAAPASCALGSIKTNIGHLDAAAGVASLIKATLAVRDGRIPASLHFAAPNPHLGLDGSPFFVARELGGWPIAGTRRAGVSSFGIGGTNAHVVLEEPPPVPAPAREPTGWTLLPLSARSPTALDAIAARLADHLKKHAVCLDDVGYTLAVGRRPFDVRRAIVCPGGRGPGELPSARAATISALEGVDRTRVVDGQVTATRPVVFMFPGQGAQHADMGLALYRTEPAFAAIVDRCAHHLRDALGFDLRDALYPSQFAGPPRDLAQTAITQPAVFVTSYALAHTLVARGVRPAAMIGHSVGEYVAACLAGVMTLPQALDLIAARGRLIQRLPAGAMLAVSLAERDAAAQLRGLPELAVAAINGPDLTVVAGPIAAIEQLASELTGRGVGARRLVTSHAFHSAMIEPAVAPLVAAASRIALQPPAVRYISNVTGTWITPLEAADPAYYGRHLRMAVRFGPGLDQILHDEPDAIVLEVGPGQTLTTLARARGLALPAARARALATLPPAKPGPTPDLAAELPPLAMTFAALWTHGAEFDLAGLFVGQARRRVPLPTYPFERQRYWIEPGAQRLAALATGEPRDLGPAGPADPTADPPAVPAPSRHPRPQLRAAYAAPDNDVEHQLCEIWAELLGVEPVGVHDNFMELGGHSLLGARMAAGLRTRFGVELPLQVMFEAPTVAELAIAIEHAVIAELEARELEARELGRG
jgi:phthiocerol/phenolphthiocerol synthesis type-I polyketide synthase E